MTSVVSSSKWLTKLCPEESGRPLVAKDRLINLEFGQGFGSWSITFIMLSVSFFFGIASSPPPTSQNTSVAIWCRWDQSCHHRAGSREKTEAKVPPLVWVGWVSNELTSQSSPSVTIRGQPPLEVSFAVQLDRPKACVGVEQSQETNFMAPSSTHGPF